MRILRQASLAELVATDGYVRRPHGFVVFILTTLNDTAQQNGTDLTAQLLSCGFIDILVSSLNAIDQVGADNVNGFAVICGSLWFLKSVGGEALGEIESKVRADARSALRYVTDSKIANFTDFGQTSSVFGTIVAANLYGRDEENSFGFARE